MSRIIGAVQSLDIADDGAARPVQAPPAASRIHGVDAATSARAEGAAAQSVAATAAEPSTAAMAAAPAVAAAGLSGSSGECVCSCRNAGDHCVQGGRQLAAACVVSAFASVRLH